MLLRNHHVDSGPRKMGPFAFGLCCGIAVGAVAGLILAPKAGVDLRRDVGESARKLRLRASEAYDSTSKAMDSVVSATLQALKAGQDAFSSGRRPNGGIDTTGASRS